MTTKIWKHPFWNNDDKTSLTVLLEIEDDTGRKRTAEARVSKFAPDGSENPDFLEILNQNPEETIDDNTAKRVENKKRQSEDDERMYKEREQAKKLENLFNSKLEVFEIEEVKNSKNRKLKAKIRRAKNIPEMMAYAIMLMQEELNNEQPT